MSKTIKIVLIIWISLGVLIGGYLIIEPIKYPFSHDTFLGTSYRYGNHGEIILLVTAVGAFLIGGIGYVLRNN